MHRFSLAHLTVLGCSPPEMTRIAAQAGYDFVSFRLLSMKLPGEPDWSLHEQPALLRETQAALRETGVGAHDMELARIHDGVDVRAYLPALEVARSLGCRSVISSVWTDDRAFATAAFAQLCDLARPLGLDVDLEFVTWASVKTLAEAAALLRAVQRPNAGLLVDTLHFDRSRVRLDELDGLPASWFHLAHLCDGPADIPASREGLIHTGRDARLYVGEGAIDIAAIVRRIPEVVYSIELPNKQRVAEHGYAEHARRCLETARRYLATREAAAPPAPGA